jgi:putative membrane protein insertion efficiency factor
VAVTPVHDGVRIVRHADVATRVLQGLVRSYQILLSPWSGGACRYTPSCSAYALESLERYGAWRGGWMALKRIARCHPWSPAGFDPVR